MKFLPGAWLAIAAVCLIVLVLPWTGSLLQAFSLNSSSSREPTVAVTGAGSDLPQVQQVGVPVYNPTSDTTSVTHVFVAPPDKHYRVEYQSGLAGSYHTLADEEGHPQVVSSGPQGVFSIVFSEAGDRTSEWKSGMFFRMTEPRAVGAVYNLPTAPPHLMAHYLPWFEDGREDGAAAPWDHWRWSSERVSHDPEERRSDGLRDIAAVQYPLIGPYSSGDPAVVRYHCETAAAAGIEGLIVLWYGPGSPTDARVNLILAEAERAGLKVALCYEEKLNWPPYRNPNTRADMVASATGDLRHLLDNYAAHPAYLRREGKPVVFQFNFWGTDRLGPRTFSPAEWEQILGALGQEVSYVRQNFDADQHPRLAGSYHWWVTDQGVLQRHQEQVAAALAEGRLVFHAGYIAPGFDDSGTDSWGSGNRRYQPREGTATLQSTFVPALAGAPEIVQIVTWNDFNEGTEVEPTVEEGFAMLDEIGRWWAPIKGHTFDGEGLRAALRQYLVGLSAERRGDTPEAAFQLGGVAK
jgi:glycoprotein endo-alpha-1,2-mannosidase